MSKFFGNVGFAITEETKPGVWKAHVKEFPYYGDVIEYSHRWSSSGQQLNDDIRLNATISIVADDFARENRHLMKYVVLDGAKWRIESAEKEYPRIKLNLGGLYNGS